MKHKLKIKVCGMRDRENIRQMRELQPDFMGYIFFPGSKRFVGKDPDREIFTISDQDIQKVGVFVNENANAVLEIFDRYSLDLVQLHGNESPSYCAEMKEKGVRIIKAINPYRDLSPELLSEYTGSVEYFLIDNPAGNYGGSGKKFDWEIIRDFDFPAPFMLSGGIGPEDTGRILSFSHERFHGVDINSRFEKSAGIKEIEKVKEFIETIRK